MPSVFERFFPSLSEQTPSLFPHLSFLIRSLHLGTAVLGLFLVEHLAPLYYPTIVATCGNWILVGGTIWIILQFLFVRPWRVAFHRGEAVNTPALIYRERIAQHASYFICVIAAPGTVALTMHPTSIPAYIYITVSCVALFMTTPILTWIEEAYVAVAAENKHWMPVASHGEGVLAALYAVTNVLLLSMYSVLAPLNTIHYATSLDHFLLIQTVWMVLLSVAFFQKWRIERSVMEVARMAIKGELPDSRTLRSVSSYPVLYAMLQAFDRIRMNITRLQHHSSEMHAGTQLIVGIAKEQSQSIVSQSSSVSLTSATIDNMVQSSAEIAEKTSTVVSMADDTEKRSAEGLSNMTESVRQLSGVREKNQVAMSDIIQLSETMREIELVLDLVTSIADDTNLIALNAAIEASSAGEHGKRFKVVAQEVRDLSDRVAQAIKKTRSLTENIHRSTQRLVETSIENVEQTDLAYGSAETTYRLLQDISTWAKRSADAARQIYVAIQHQRLSNQEISGSFQDIATEIKSLATASQRYREYAQTLSKFSTSMEDVLRQYRISPNGDGFL